jgi:hypothetical protein
MIGRISKLGDIIVPPRKEGPLCAQCGHHLGMHPTIDLSDTRCRGGKGECECKSCVFVSWTDLVTAHVEGGSLVALWEYRVKDRVIQ